MTSPEKLLFLPGAAGTPSFWEPVAQLLHHPASQELLCWPGFGSTPADPNIKGIEDLVTKIISNIKQPTALIAQSMGGVVAMQVAMRLPELITHLVLTVTSGGVDVSDIQSEDWRPAFQKNNPTFPRWFSDYHADLSVELNLINVPVLLLWGDSDPISPVAIGERLRARLSCSRLHVINGGAHNLANAFASTIAPLIDAHLLTGNDRSS
jgi:poly(3-hydroxyoctanoate) depolymerase